jgi:hypothetical protein
MSNQPVPFDTQADTYDRRVGLPEQDCQAIGHAVPTVLAAPPARRGSPAGVARSKG